jgi:hypothetical protein
VANGRYKSWGYFTRRQTVPLDTHDPHENDAHLRSQDVRDTGLALASLSSTAIALRSLCGAACHGSCLCVPFDIPAVVVRHPEGAA